MAAFRFPPAAKFAIDRKLLWGANLETRIDQELLRAESRRGEERFFLAADPLTFYRIVSYKNGPVFMHEEKVQEATVEIVTQSAEETIQMGKDLGELLGPGVVVALIGELGAGKTTLAKGIARGLGVADENQVTSPSFVLVNEYQGRFPVYHADLYRLQDAEEVENLGWEEFIFAEGIALLEWAEKFPGIMPEERIEIKVFWIAAGERRFLISGKGAQAETILLLKKKWKKEE